MLKSLKISFVLFCKKCKGSLLPASFTAIILLMIFTAQFASTNISQSVDSMTTSIKDQNKNNILLGTMSQAAFRRTTLLTEMLRSDDPFKNDELFSELNDFGTKFAEARAKITDKSGSKKLQQLLEKQYRIAKVNGPLQGEIYELIFNEDNERANSLFSSIALPTMNKHLDSINDMVSYQFKLTDNIIGRSEKEIFTTLSSIKILNIMSIIISIFLALFVLKKKKEGDLKLAFFASSDTLTNLPNRRHFIETVDHHILSKPNEVFAIVFFDIDYFKNINDTYGHEIGDEVLIHFSKTIQSTLKSDDVLSRFGGDEFVLLLRSIESEKQADLFISELSSLLDTSFVINDTEVFITSSIGVSMFQNNANTTSSLLKNADLAMYAAKEAGKNCYKTFSKENHEKFEKEKATCHALHTILNKGNKNKELYLMYQPLLNINDSKFSDCEALIRWTNDDGITTMPDDFIPLAEKSNLIEKISLFVIDEACKQQSEWQRNGLKDVRIHINLSGNKIIFEKLLSHFKANIESRGLYPSLFGIELTERTLNYISDETIRQLDQLRRLGMKIAIDDFGTDYSSLSQLKKLPITTLKIDKAFISGLDDDKDDQALVKTIIQMGHSLQLEIVAEGVETYEQLNFLKENCCNTAQGYFFHHPLKSKHISHLKLVA
ncbi:MAG: EAL domain-containing protein [Cocleimonas sp.]